MFIELLGLNTIKINYEQSAGYSEALDRGLLPIASDDGDLICVNTTKGTERLFLYSHEEDDFQEIRDTLEVFLTKLIADKEQHERQRSK